MARDKERDLCGGKPQSRAIVEWAGGKIWAAGEGVQLSRIAIIFLDYQMRFLEFSTSSNL